MQHFGEINELGPLLTVGRENIDSAREEMYMQRHFN